MGNVVFDSRWQNMSHALLQQAYISVVKINSDKSGLILSPFHLLIISNYYPRYVNNAVNFNIDEQQVFQPLSFIKNQQQLSNSGKEVRTADESQAKIFVYAPKVDSFLLQYWHWLVVAFILFLIMLFLLIYISGLMRQLMQSNKKLKKEIELRAELEKKLTQQALYDPLTEIPNRTLLSDRLQQAVYNANRDSGSFAVALIDLNNFKEINDNYGHDMGDRVLKQVAQRFKGLIRKTDTIARIGGDEFVMLILDINDSSAIVNIIEKTLDLLSQPLLLDGHEFQIEASAGVSQFPLDATEPTELLKQADMSMYRAKNAYNKRLCLWSSDCE